MLPLPFLSFPCTYELYKKENRRVDQRSQFSHHSREVNSTAPTPHPPVANLIEIPVGRRTPDAQVREILEGLVRKVDAKLVAAHALVDDLGRRGLAHIFDGDGLAAERVAVGLLTHQQVRKRDDVIGFAVVVPAAGAEPGCVVRDVAAAGAAAIGALPAAGSAAGATA